MILIFVSTVLIGLLGFVWYVLSPRTKVVSTVPSEWKGVLNRQVLFYRNLNAQQKCQFESDVYNFLNHVTITGVKVNVDLTDRLLVASSAVIPLFGFPQWTYAHLEEVLLYPGSFDQQYNVGSPNATISGMVGNGPLEGKVIISKPALHKGFEITNDKKNVGIHEFVHLFDKEDGLIDALPPGYQTDHFIAPWLALISQKMKEIKASKSTIDEYGAYNQKEFFAVISEYFFERPHLLKRKEPVVYEHLVQIFKQDPTMIIGKQTSSLSIEISRNAPCPCGSGRKFKRCCI